MQFFFTNVDSGTRIFELYSNQTSESITCPHCGSRMHVYDNASVNLREIPFNSLYYTIFKVHVHRYRCTKCRASITENIPFKYKGARITDNAAEFVKISPDASVTGKPPVPLQTKNKRKRGTSCENSSFFVFCISTRPASLLARLFHLGNPLFAFFRKLLRPWKQVLQEIQIRIIHVFRNLGQQMRNVVEDIQIVEFAGFPQC